MPSYSILVEGTIVPREVDLPAVVPFGTYESWPFIGISEAGLFGVGFLWQVEGIEVPYDWFLHTPDGNHLVRSWRAMQLLDRLRYLDENSLYYSYDAAYNEERYPNVPWGTIKETCALRAEVLCARPTDDEIGLMMLKMRHLNIPFMEQEVELEWNSKRSSVRDMYRRLLVANAPPLPTSNASMRVVGPLSRAFLYTRTKQ